MILCLYGCSAGDPAITRIAPGAEEAGSRVVEEVNKVLVAPFDCSVLPAEQAETARMLQNMLSARLVYFLQSAGVPAEQYLPDGASRAPQVYDYVPLLPASRIFKKETIMGNQAVVPIREDGTIIMEELDERDVPVIPPRDAQQYGVSRQSSPDSVRPSDSLPGNTRSSALEAARERGFDYIIAGTIAMVRTEVSPSVQIGGMERTLARAELHAAFQLIYTRDGRVTKAGAAEGRDAVNVRGAGGRLNDNQVVSAVDKVMQRAIQQVSLRAAETLTGRYLTASAQEMEEERDYYRDSPGKRLRSE